MALFRTLSATVFGIDAYIVQVEVDLSIRTNGNDLPSPINIVGLPDIAVRESRERIRAAISNCGFMFPFQRITVNLAPADVRKEGSGLDLPIAIGILGSMEVVQNKRIKESILFGELSLDGQVRPVKGALSIALKAREIGIKHLFVPKENSQETAVVKNLNTYSVSTLAEAIKLLNEETLPEPLTINSSDSCTNTNVYSIDFAEIRGQFHAKRALEVATAGGHNILMIGPPGSGKTMLAKRISSILPEPTFEEALEVTRIHSVTATNNTNGLITNRPFRSPHHTISDAGLIGGGNIPRPGEVSLSHNGVLFLDELPEFERNVLEGLRQPLEDGKVTISRASVSLTFPARFMLAAAMNPCPCGFFNDPTRDCKCSPTQIQRYIARISGPLLDRIDIHIDVPAVKFQDLAGDITGETSKEIRTRVTKARQIQLTRFEKEQVSGKFFCNAQMPPKLIRIHCKIGQEAKHLLEKAINRMGLSARAYDRILKVSRTIADLENSIEILSDHVAEAIQYRSLDRNYWV